jgi:hypothetical protein
MGRLATPLHWPIAHGHPMIGQGMPARHRLVLSRRCLSGEGKPPGASLMVRAFVLSVPVHGISHSKKSSYQAVLTPW